MKKIITVYGTTWCPDCMLAKMVLDKNKIAYQFIDIATDAKGAQKVEEINGGFRSVPTIVFPDGKIMVEPSFQELTKTFSTIVV